MRGHTERIWQSDPALYAPPRYRRACSYTTFTPDSVASFNEVFPAELAGIIAEAEAAVHSLNDRARPALAPLARLLLRTESIASSKVEGLQVDPRSLARAEVNAAAGKQAGSVVAEVIANIDAMELAIEETSVAPVLGQREIVAIHWSLMQGAPNASVAGRVRDKQNWIGGNDYNPCGATFVPCPPENVEPLLADLTELCASDYLSPLVQAAIVHAQFETIHPFEDGNGRTRPCPGTRATSPARSRAQLRPPDQRRACGRQGQLHQRPDRVSRRQRQRVVGEVRHRHGPISAVSAEIPRRGREPAKGMAS